MSTLQLLLDWTIRSSVLILSGALALRVLRVKNPSLRLAAWSAMLLCSMALPALTLVLPPVPTRFHVFPARTPRMRVPAIPASAIEQTFAEYRNEETRIQSATPRTSSTAPESRVAFPNVSWPSIFLLVYSLVAGALLFRLGLRLVLSFRMLPHTRPVGRSINGIAIHESDRITTPATMRIMRPMIVLPADWREWESARLDAVLAHECAHARRYDPALQLLSAIHRSLLWHNPLSWFLDRCMVRTSEEASDNAALSVVPDRPFYAQILLDFTLRSAGRAWGVPMARYERPDKRIHRILDGTSIPGGVTRRRIAALLVLGSPLAYVIAAAQNPGTATPAQTTDSPGSGAKFELADVHVSKTAFWFAQGNNNPGAIRDRVFIIRDASLLKLIELAYGISEDTVAGGPSWLDSDLFDVVAKVPEGTTRDAANRMLQPLLGERFGLVMRKATRPMQRYVLEIARGGPKMKAAAVSDESGCHAQPLTPDAGPLANIKFNCRNLTAQQIADNLPRMAGGYTSYLSHDVVNSTGLKGAWDFDLEFAPPLSLPDRGRDAITLFDAVNKQLGLTLTLKDTPVPVMVIESVNRTPAANPPEVAKDLAFAEPRFEAAAIKPPDPSQPKLTGFRYMGGSQMKINGTLRGLISLSLQIQPNASNDLVVGLPKSADLEFWEITAKLPAAGEGAPIGGNRPQPPPLSVVLSMLRGLLADQFELKTHTADREVTVYALTQDGKIKMTRANPSERSECKPDPNAPKPFPNIGTMVNCKNITMAEFARNLEQATGFFDHPIVDATGLPGGWSFLLGWSRVNQMAAPPPAANGAVADTPEPGGISAYDAVQKELGLKLVKQKRTVPVIVVDHVDLKPVE